MGKSYISEISYFPHPLSGKEQQNLFTSEIVKLAFYSLGGLLKFRLAFDSDSSPKLRLKHKTNLFHSLASGVLPLYKLNLKASLRMNIIERRTQITAKRAT